MSGGHCAVGEALAASGLMALIGFDAVPRGFAVIDLTR